MAFTARPSEFSYKNNDNPHRHVRRGGQRVDKRARYAWGSRAEMARSRSRSPRGTSPRAKARSRSPAPADRKQDKNSASRSPARKENAPPANGSNARVVVHNLTRNVRTEHLNEIFGTFGPIKEAGLDMDERKRVPKGSAFVEYDSRDAATEAIAAMDGAQIDGNQVSVRFLAGLPPPLSRRDSPPRDRDRDRRDDGRRGSPLRRRSPDRRAGGGFGRGGYSMRGRSPPRGGYGGRGRMRSPLRHGGGGRRGSPLRRGSPMRRRYSRSRSRSRSRRRSRSSRSSSSSSSSRSRSRSRRRSRSRSRGRGGRGGAVRR